MKLMPDSHERRLTSPAAETPLLTWLLTALQPMNRTRVKQLLRSGSVRVNGTSVTQHDHPIGPADRIGISHEAANRSAAAVAILHEDEAVIAIDKPCGLLAVASDTEKEDTAFVRLSTHLEARKAGRPFVVHRLDRETSGVLLFARSPETRDALQRSWDAIEKTYLAVVEGPPHPAEGTIENHLIEGDNLRVRIVRPGGTAKLAITRYRVLASHRGYSLLEVKLETGRKHQIRVHLASIGCPVIGDSGYGARSNPARRLGLHAWRLRFPHPISGEALAIESPFPAELNRIVNHPPTL